MQLDRDEDPVDAVLCAYVALYWYQRPDDVTIYGDFETGYIVTPSLPPDLTPAPRRRVVPPPSDELHERLSHLEELLAQAQIEAEDDPRTAVPDVSQRLVGCVGQMRRVGDACVLARRACG